jgi:hypothetical protein
MWALNLVSITEIFVKLTSPIQRSVDSEQKSGRKGVQFRQVSLYCISLILRDISTTLFMALMFILFSFFLSLGQWTCTSRNVFTEWGSIDTILVPYRYVRETRFPVRYQSTNKRITGNSDQGVYHMVSMLCFWALF